MLIPFSSVPRMYPVLFTAALCLVLAGCGAGEETGTVLGSDNAGDADSADLTFLNWSPDAEYVGRDTCGECHQAQHETFIRSQMGRSWKHARLSLSDADWDGLAPLYSEYDDLYYLPFARAENLFVREYRIVDGDTVHNRVEQIDFIVGSGHHTNSHIYEENGYLYQIPVTWYAQDEKWGLAPKFQKAANNYRFERVITDECMACHNGQPEFVAGSENRFEAVPSGIGCEKCHGPGSIHVERIRAGEVVDVATGYDPSIVNPAKLSPEREMDVCARCHMQGASVFREGETPLDWRPGKPLASHENVFWPRQPDSTEHFIMASHPDRLWMSECYLSTWEEDSAFEKMTCLTCHDPHLPIEEQRRTSSSSAVCQSCHAGADLAGPTTPGCTEPTVIAGTAEATCIDCHMPESYTTDIPNVRVTDHYIRIPDPPTDPLTPDEVESARRLVRMASLVVDAPTDLDVANGFLTYYEQVTNRPGMLDSARVRLAEARRAGDEQGLVTSTIRLWYLQGEYGSIRRYVTSGEFEDPSDAWTYYRIGEAYSNEARHAEAVTWLERAVDLGPDHLRFLDKLGISLTQSGRLAEALRVYDRLLSLNPRFEAGWNNRGFARLAGGDLEAAEEDFRTALSLNPNLELAKANLASLLYNLGRSGEARPLVRELMNRHPENRQYDQMWQLVSGG